MHWMHEGTNACSNRGQNQRETTFDGNPINLPPKQSELIHIKKLVIAFIVIAGLTDETSVYFNY